MYSVIHKSEQACKNWENMIKKMTLKLTAMHSGIQILPKKHRLIGSLYWLWFSREHNVN